MEAKKLNDGRTAIVCLGHAGGVEPGEQLVMDGEILTVTGRRFGPPLRDECERQVTLYFAETLQSSRGDEYQSVYHLVKVT